MSLYQKELIDLLTRYKKAKYGTDTTPEAILYLTPYEQAIYRFDAWAYFGEERHFMSLDQVPEEYKDGERIHIRVPGKRMLYRWIEGKWEYEGEISDSLYK